MGEVTQVVSPPTAQFTLDDAKLQGTTVIEASAGTGKTWTIEQIVLQRVKEGISIEQMLLTSFTRAAAAELSQRVNEVLRKAVQECAAPGVTLDEEGRRRLGRVQAALLSFDSACITTIDGFCLRMLQEHAAAAGASGLTGWQLDPDSKGSEARALDDAWSGSAILDEVWAMTVGGVGPVRRALADALWNPAKREKLGEDGYRKAASAWGAWVDAFVAMPNVDALFDRLTKLLKVTAKGDLSSLRDDLGRVRACANPQLRSLAAIDLAGSVSTITPWITSASGVLAVAFVNDDAVKAVKTLTGEPLFATLSAQLTQGVCLWTQTVHAATQVIATDARARLATNRARLRLFSFQDVLERLVEALRVEESPLRAAIREQFKFAVVDEFQDTNQLQAEILRRVFVESPTHDLFLVGDPKQSIYAFRGADIESYIALRDRVESDASRTHRRSLAVSHRADTALVSAVNTLFEPSGSFFHQAINPDAVKSCFPEARTKWNGPIKDAGIVIHHGIEEETLNVAWPRIARAIQEELAAGNMVRESAAGALRPLRPSDIAVLCHKHAQNHALADQLYALGVPAIVLSNATVFESDAADEVAQLLCAIARPDWRAAALAACAGRLVGMTYAQSRDEPAMWLARVRQAGDTLETHGAAVAIEQLVASGKSCEHGIEGVVGEAEGERLVRDYRHLLERLTAAEGEGIRGANALACWFAEQLEGVGIGDGMGGDGPDRSRSIGHVDAVTLQTLHSSKGLTYGITWLPTFMGAQSKEGNNEREPSDEARQKVAGEGRRMLYVGLTRSRWRSHLVWLQSGGKSSSALATIVHARDCTDAKNAQAKAKQRMDNFDDAIVDLTALAALSANTIAVAPLPLAHDVPTPSAPLDALVPAHPMPEISRRQDQVSFTALTRKAHRDDGQSEWDRDRTTSRRDPNESGYASACDKAIASLKVGGVALGTALHEALAEPRAFAALAAGADRTPLEKTLREKFAGVVAELPAESSTFTDLAAALASALGAPCANAAIASVRALAAHPNTSRREMNITTPWNGSPQDIAAAFASEPAPWSKPLAQIINGLSRGELKGLFVGNIDLVAVREGKWFIYDYKSNHLGTSAGDYSSVRVGGALSPLDEAMVKSLYPLQAALYAVAIEQWLATRRSHAAPFGTSIGGIAYLFLRGMDATLTGQGIWEWHPSAAFVSSLSRCFSVGVER